MPFDLIDYLIIAGMSLIAFGAGAITGSIWTCKHINNLITEENEDEHARQCQPLRRYGEQTTRRTSKDQQKR